MSNVIIGIIGVILFIGMAVAGASYFGPRLHESTTKSQAVAIVQVNATIATGVVVRDREVEGVTQANADLETLLVPNYIIELPSNPLGFEQPVLLSASGGLTGPAAFVAMKVSGSQPISTCNAINQKGGGGKVENSQTTANLNQLVGCFRVNRDINAEIRKDDFVAYSALSG